MKQTCKILNYSRANLIRLRKRDSALAKQIKTLEGEIDAMSREKTKIEEQLAQLLDIASSQCPTCGSELTEEHRQQVAGQLGLHRCANG